MNVRLLFLSWPTLLAPHQPHTHPTLYCHCWHETVTKRARGKEKKEDTKDAGRGNCKHRRTQAHIATTENRIQLQTGGGGEKGWGGGEEDRRRVERSWRNKSLVERLYGKVQECKTISEGEVKMKHLS